MVVPYTRFPVRPRRLKRAMFWLLLGALVSVAVAWAFALFADPSGGVAQSAEAINVHHHWTVRRWTSPGILRVESTCEPADKRPWGTEQLIGPPDTQGAGDINTAWASRTQDGQPEWLILDYEKPVVPAAVHVVETYNPGALVKVSVFNLVGQETTVWEGSDPTVPGSDRGVSKIPVKTDFPTRRVKLYLDSPHVYGWNEIDAVALSDRQGGVQWAVAAQASSTFADQYGVSGSPESLIPSWSCIVKPSDDPASVPAATAGHLSAGFGWPLPAMHAEKDLAPGASSGPTVPFPGGWGSKGTFRIIPPPAPAPRLFPFRPIWTGLLPDAAVYGFALWLLHLLLTRPLHICRELMRLRRGQCLHCGYNLRYDFVAGCPECGWQRAKTADT